MREDEKNDALTQQIYQAVRNSFPPYGQPEFYWGCNKMREVITFRTIRAYVQGDSVGHFDGKMLMESLPKDAVLQPGYNDKEAIIKGDSFELRLLCAPNAGKTGNEQ